MKVPGRAERIVKPGHNAQNRNRINENAIENADVVVGISRAQDDQEHENDLSSSRKLAVNAGRKWPVAGGQQNHDGDNEDQHVTAENQDGEPPGKLFLKRQ